MARRRLYRGSDFRKALSIAELREIAKRRLPAFSLEFLESGGEDEVTLGWNRDVFKSLRFVPKTLVNTSSCNIDAVHRSGQELAQFPHLKRWFETIRARDAVKRAFAIRIEAASAVDPRDPKVRAILFGQRTRE